MTVLQTTNLASSTVKMQWKEQYVTAALNQKDLGAAPKGVQAGFTVVPAGGLVVTIQVDPTLGVSVANVTETTGGLYRVSVVQTSNINIDLTPQANTTVFIVLDATYSIGTTSSASLKVVDALTDPDWVVLAKVNVPAAVITASDINMGYRHSAGDSSPPEMAPHFNLVYNPTFEATAAGWTNTGFDSVTASTDFAHTGLYSLKLVKAAAGLVDVTSGPMPVAPNRKYRVSAWMHSPAGLTGNGGKLQVGWFDAAGAQISTWVDVETAVTSATTSFVECKAEVTAPTLALNSKLRILFDNSSGTLYVDDVEFSSHTHDEVMKSAVFGGPNVSADSFHTHTALGLTYAGSSPNTWADSTTLPSGLIETAIDNIVSTLGGVSGASKIGNCPSKIATNTFTQLNTFNNGISVGNGAALTTGDLTFSTAGQGLAWPNFRVEEDTGSGAWELSFPANSNYLRWSTPFSSMSSMVIGTNPSGANTAATVFVSDTAGMGITLTNPTTALPIVFSNGTPTATAKWRIAGTGELQAQGGNRAIQNVLDPVSAQDAATKNYVDARAQALNAVINGGLAYWQRGSSFTYSTPVTGSGYFFYGYTADRWYAQVRRDTGGPGSINMSIIRATATDLQDTNTTVRLKSNSSVSSQFYQLIQEIDRETVVHLRNKKISWRVAVRKGSTSANNTDCFIEVHSNTGPASEKFSAYSGMAVVGSIFVSGSSLSTTTWTYVTGTSTAVLPANVNGLSILLGAYHNGGGLGDADDYLEFGEVSLVAADLPPMRFDWAGGSVAAEQVLCERYYEKSYDTDTAPSTLTLNGIQVVPVSSLGALATVSFRTSKRVPPTITFWRSQTAVSNEWDHPSGTTGMTVPYVSTTSFYPAATSVPNAVPVNTTVSGHWVADAEI